MINLFNILLIFNILIILNPLIVLSDPIPDTGQTRSYTDIIGEDSDYNINLPSYTKLDENGKLLDNSINKWSMVKDNNTGLIWEVKTDDSSIHDKDNVYNWDYNNDSSESESNQLTISSTSQFIRELNNSEFGNYSDWRLPTIKELAAIVNVQEYNLTINKQFFPNTVSSYYWSDTTYANDQSLAWCIYFNSINLIYQDKSNKYHVRAVRGTPVWFSNHFIDNNDQTITNIDTGLMWQKTGPEYQMQWEDAINYCQNLVIDQYSDWRLPNREELRSLVDYNSFDKSININAFSDTKNSEYWSSTTDARDHSNAWSISFIDGNDYIKKKFNGLFVRAVRGGQNISQYPEIIFPKQAARLDIGSLIEIKWKLKDLQNNNIKISLSRDAGKQGTFELITDFIENSGNYKWQVTGPASVNCVLLIEFKDINLNISSGLFTIDKLQYHYIESEKNEYLISTTPVFLSVYSLFTEKINSLFQISEPSIAGIHGNIIYGKSNGCVIISTIHNDLVYKKPACFKLNDDSFEKEPNNKMAFAAKIEHEIFMKGEMLSNDIDYFYFDLIQDSLITISFSNESQNADILVSVLNSAGNDMAYAKSINGKEIFINIGLEKGTYFIKLLPQGDIDENAFYNIIYKKIELLENFNQNEIVIDQKNNFTAYNLMDKIKIDIISDNYQTAIFRITPNTINADYKLQLFNKDEFVIIEKDIINMPEVFESNIDKGHYLLIQPLNAVDALHPLSIEINTKYYLEVENNNSFVDAYEVNKLKSVKGELNINDIQDFIAINNTQFANANFTFDVNPDNIGSLYLNIYKESENNRFFSYVYQSQGIKEAFISLSKGKYFFKVFVPVINENDTINYIININETNLYKSELEANNSFQFANPIDKDNIVTGTINSFNDIDVFGFTIIKPAEFKIFFNNQSNVSDYKIKLINKDKSIIYEKSSINGANIILSGNMNEGLYYIWVESNGDIDPYLPYTIEIKTTDPLVNIFPYKQLSSISIISPKNSIEIDEEIDLDAIGFLTDGNELEITNTTWSVNNETIANINNKGILKGINNGYATIMAAIDGNFIDSITIKVGNPLDSFLKPYGNLILIAGDTINSDSSLKPAISYLSCRIYNIFKKRLLDDEDIFFFNNTNYFDINLDGFDDGVVDSVSLTNYKLEEAITNWASNQNTKEPLYLYFVGHSSIDKFYLSDQDVLTPEKLKTYLDSFQNKTGRTVIVFFESVSSGSFIYKLISGNKERIIISSTDSLNSYLFLEGRLSFSQLFFDQVLCGKTLQDSYLYAKQILKTCISPFKNMEPLLAEIPFNASNQVISGSGFKTEAQYLTIYNQSPDQLVSLNSNINLYVDIEKPDNVQSVTAVIEPPDYAAPSNDQNFTNIEIKLETLQLYNDINKDRFENIYQNFNKLGNYRICFLAQNNAGIVSMSKTTLIAVSDELALDTDGDQMPDEWEEKYYKLNKYVYDSGLDIDNDGLDNLSEYKYNTDPSNNDSDNDHMFDGWEIDNNLDPNNPNDAFLDSDGDKISNYQEYIEGTDPHDIHSYIPHFGKIKGRIFSDILGYNAGLKNVLIKVKDNNYQTKSKDDGSFTLDNIPFNRYIILLSCPFFKDKQLNVNIYNEIISLDNIYMELKNTERMCDSDGDGRLELEDIIMGLQQLTK